MMTVQVTKNIIYLYGLLFFPISIVAQTSFVKTIGGGQDDEATSIIQTLDNGFIIGGHTESYGQGNKDIYLIKVDNLGATQWTKTIGGNLEEQLSTIKSTTDGGFVAVGSTESYGAGSKDAYIIKYNSNGQILWNKWLGSTEDEAATDVLITSDGGFLVVGYSESYSANSNQDVLVVKLSAQGDVMWQKNLAASGDEVATSVIEHNNQYIITGYFKNYGILELDGFILQIGLNGQFQQFTTQGNGFSNCHHHISHMPTGNYRIGGSLSTMNRQYEMTLIETDATGNFIQQKKYQTQQQNIAITQILPTASNEIIALGQAKQTANSAGYLLKLDTQGNVLWSRQYQANSNTVFKAAIIANDGSIVAVGSSVDVSTFQKEILIVKTTVNGLIPNCTIVADVNVTTSNLNFVAINRSLNTTNNNDYQTSMPSITTPNSPLVSTLCQHLEIADFTMESPSICINSCVQFTDESHQSALSWEWAFEGGSPATFSGQFPPQICYNNAGDYTVKLVVTHAEGIDSTEKSITVNDIPIIDLGEDITLCTGEDLTLDATINGAAYLWQDGSTTAQFLVSTPGEYAVTVTKNNCSFQDIVQVNYYPTLSLNLGNDTAICHNSTIQLNTNIDNATYLWQDGSINTDFLVETEGSYQVEVTDENGCTVTDEIQVDFIASPVLVLPNDITICDLNQVELNAFHTSIDAYAWQGESAYYGQNDLASPTFTASFSGNYALTVANVCTTLTQTIQVIKEDCSCTPYIPNAFSPNQDGVNDALQVFSNCSISDFSMQVFDRWGNLIFQTKDIENGWNGTAKGQALRSGVYLCKINFAAMDSKGVLQHQTLVQDVTLME